MRRQLKYGLVLLMMVSSATATAATSATLTLSGSVTPLLRIGFDASGATTTTTHTFAADELLSFTNVAVGTIHDSSNNRATNYKVTVTSTNAGKMIHSTVSGAEVNYTLSIAGTSVSANELATAAEFTVDTSAYTGRTTVSRAVTISGGNSDALSGSYSDTITFAVVSL